MAEARSAEAPADQLKPLLDEATLIGSGSYGLVYKGSMKGRRCVAKHATPGNKKASSYLEREAAVNDRLRREPKLQKHLAPFLGQYQTGSGAACLLWDFKEGATHTLLDYIEPHIAPGASAPSSALGVDALASALGVARSLVLWEVLEQLSFALQAMHDAGVIYRDLKPDNILVDKSSRSLRFIDLGSAADLQALAGASRYKPGILPCSPLYMAPEATIDWGNPYAFDCYSLGVTMLRLAFPGHITSEAALEKFVKELSHRNHDLDKWLQDRLSRTLVDQGLLAGLSAFRGNGSPAQEEAAPTLGTAGWKLLRGLLVGDPKRRLTLAGVRSVPAMNRALAKTSTAEATAEVSGGGDRGGGSGSGKYDDAGDDESCLIAPEQERPALIHVSLPKPLGMVLEERAFGADQSVEGGLVVVRLAEGGAAEESGAVEVGDWLKMVGSRDVSNGNFDDVMKLLRFGTGNSRAMVELTLERQYSRDAAPSSGGTIARRIAVRDRGQFLDQGGRSHMEDRVVVHQLDADNLLVAVFDGHAGASAANFAARRIVGEFEAAAVEDRPSTLLRAWRTMCCDWAGRGNETGTTATVALLENEAVYAINCGDSRAALVQIDRIRQRQRRVGTVVGVTVDHRVDDPTELERLSAAGGEVSCDRGVMRIVKGDWRLAVARAMTSASWLRSGVSNEADAYTWTDLACDDAGGEGPSHALIVATDGVWNSVSTKDAARLVAEWSSVEGGISAELAAKMLCDEAMRRGGNDNRAAVVVFMQAAGG